MSGGRTWNLSGAGYFASKRFWMVGADYRGAVTNGQKEKCRAFLIRNLRRSPLNADPVCSGAFPDRSEPLSLPASSCLASPRSPTGRRPDRVGCTRSRSTAMALSPARTASASAYGRARPRIIRAPSLASASPSPRCRSIAASGGLVFVEDSKRVNAQVIESGRSCGTEKTS
jgi:hypothetical protein